MTPAQKFEKGDLVYCDDLDWLCIALEDADEDEITQVRIFDFGYGFPAIRHLHTKDLTLISKGEFK